MLDAQINRRRIVQGALWVTPAIVIAAAAPAAAASPPIQGRVALTGASAAMNTANFFATATVNYVGDGPPHADHPVSGVTLTVSIPTSRVVAGTPGVTSLNWSYVGSLTSGGNTLYTFAWNGLPLGSTNPMTNQVTVKIPATASLDPVNIVFTANGTSNGSPVTPATQTVAVGMGADLVVDNAVTDFINWMPNPSGGQQNGYRMQGAGRWAGPYWPVGATITDLRLVIRIPAANTDGTYQALLLGAGWSLDQAPALSNGVWQASWKFATPIQSGANQSTTGWDIAFKAIGAKQLNVVTSALYGLANGSPNYFTWSGPTS